MECETVREKLPDYLMDSLDELSGTAIRSHWNTCQSCREEAESLEGVWAKLGTLPSEEPAPRVRARFEAMARSLRGRSGQRAPGTAMARSTKRLDRRLVAQATTDSGGFRHGASDRGPRGGHTVRRVRNHPGEETSSHCRARSRASANWWRCRCSISSRPLNGFEG